MSNENAFNLLVNAFEAYFALDEADQEQCLQAARQQAASASAAKALTVSAWNGTWALESREGYDAILRYNGVPEEKMAEATAAEDYWSYEFAADGSTFHMDHSIPATGFHLNYVANIDGEWHAECPYQRTGTTASRWKCDSEKESEDVPNGHGKPTGWKHTWEDPSARTRFTTELRNSDGSLLRFDRHLVSGGQAIVSEINIVRVDEATDTETVIAGPASCRFVKTGDTLPRAPADLLNPGKWVDNPDYAGSFNKGFLGPETTE